MGTKQKRKSGGLAIAPIVKMVIAVLLLLCLADMPYGFYEFVRFAVAAAFVYLSYDSFKEKKDLKGFVFAGLALLFQPFFKLALGRTLWNFIDVIVVAALVILVLKAFGKKSK